MWRNFAKRYFARCGYNAKRYFARCGCNAKSYLARCGCKGKRYVAQCDCKAKRNFAQSDCKAKRNFAQSEAQFRLMRLQSEAQISLEATAKRTAISLEATAKRSAISLAATAKRSAISLDARAKRWVKCIANGQICMRWRVSLDAESHQKDEKESRETQSPALKPQLRFPHFAGDCDGTKRWYQTSSTSTRRDHVDRRIGAKYWYASNTNFRSKTWKFYNWLNAAIEEKRPIRSDQYSKNQN
jgi:hypothetical protein